MPEGAFPQTATNSPTITGTGPDPDQLNRRTRHDSSKGRTAGARVAHVTCAPGEARSDNTIVRCAAPMSMCHVCSHFTRTTLTNLFKAAGYSIAASSQSWVVKEISAVITPVGNHVDSGVHPSADLTAGLEWLRTARAAAGCARAEAGRRPFGIFGSSIAATWLAHEVDRAMHFFVDGDPNRQGQHFMGQRVLSPSQVPAGSVVFVGLGGGVAEDVAWRLSHRPRPRYSGFRRRRWSELPKCSIWTSGSGDNGISSATHRRRRTGRIG